MAVTQDGIDKAVITVAEQVDGAFVTTLPWQFVEFADASEAGVRYWMPSNQGLHHVGAQPFRMKREGMRFAAWPHDTDAPARGNSTQDDSNKPGPMGVNYLSVI